MLDGYRLLLLLMKTLNPKLTTSQALHINGGWPIHTHRNSVYMTTRLSLCVRCDFIEAFQRTPYTT